jgi:hypothetical protein
MIIHNTIRNKNQPEYKNSDLSEKNIVFLKTEEILDKLQMQPSSLHKRIKPKVTIVVRQTSKKVPIGPPNS